MKLKAIFLLISSTVVAGTPTRTPIEPPTAPAVFERLGSLTTFYKSKRTFINEVSLFGRAHVTWSYVDMDQSEWSDWELRRLRTGLRVKFADEFDLKTEVRFLPFEDPIYGGLTEASLSWNTDPALGVSIGRQLPRYTQEGGISSNDLLTIERSLLANTFWVGEDNYSTGLSASGRAGAWNYYAAILSGESDKAFGRLSAGWYGVASLGYDLARPLRLERAVLRADYVHNDGDPGNTTTKPFDHTYALGWEVKKARWGLVGNVVNGTGLSKEPDVWGVVVLPTYDLTEKLQLITRYTYLHSAGIDGLKPQRRYENEVPLIEGTRGDRYHALYAGLNYYLHGHKLKLQAGVEYSRMNDSARNGGDFDAWIYSAGFRFSF